MQSDSSGRRVSFIATARREQIIQAAVRVLATKGYAGASLARIAEEAGVAKGVVSYHFDGKDDLLEQVVVDAYTRGAQEITPQILAAGDAAGRLRAYLEGNITFLDRHRDQIVALGEVFLNLRRPDGRLRFDAEGSEQIAQPLADLLLAGQQTGEFADFDPRAVAYLIRDAIDGIGARVRLDPDYDIAAFGRELINFAERAIHRQTDAEDPTW